MIYIKNKVAISNFIHAVFYLLDCGNPRCFSAMSDENRDLYQEALDKNFHMLTFTNDQLNFIYTLLDRFISQDRETILNHPFLRPMNWFKNGNASKNEDPMKAYAKAHPDNYFSYYNEKMFHQELQPVMHKQNSLNENWLNLLAYYVHSLLFSPYLYLRHESSDQPLKYPETGQKKSGFIAYTGISYKNLDEVKEAVTFIATVFRNFIRYELLFNKPKNQTADSLFLYKEIIDNQNNKSIKKVFNPDYEKLNPENYAYIKQIEVNFLSWVQQKRQEYLHRVQSDDSESAASLMLDEVYGFGNDEPTDFSYDSVGRNVFDKLLFLESNLKGALLRKNPYAENDLRELCDLLGYEFNLTSLDLTNILYQNTLHHRTPFFLPKQNFSIQTPTKKSNTNELDHKQISTKLIALFIQSCEYHCELQGFVNDIKSVFIKDNIQFFTDTILKWANLPSSLSAAVTLLKNYQDYFKFTENTSNYNGFINVIYEYFEIAFMMLLKNSPGPYLSFPDYELSSSKIKLAYEYFIKQLCLIFNTHKTKLNHLIQLKSDGFYVDDSLIFPLNFNNSLMQLVTLLKQQGKDVFPISFFYVACNSTQKVNLFNKLNSEIPDNILTVPLPELMTNLFESDKHFKSLVKDYTYILFSLHQSNKWNHLPDKVFSPKFTEKNIESLLQKITDYLKEKYAIPGDTPLSTVAKIIKDSAYYKQFASSHLTGLIYNNTKLFTLFTNVNTTEPKQSPIIYSGIGLILTLNYNRNALIVEFVSRFRHPDNQQTYIQKLPAFEKDIAEHSQIIAIYLHRDEIQHIKSAYPDVMNALKFFLAQQLSATVNPETGYLRISFEKLIKDRESLEHLCLLSRALPGSLRYFDILSNGKCETIGFETVIIKPFKHNQPNPQNPEEISNFHYGLI